MDREPRKTDQWERLQPTCLSSLMWDMPGLDLEHNISHKDARGQIKMSIFKCVNCYVIQYPLNITWHSWNAKMIDGFDRLLLLWWCRFLLPCECVVEFMVRISAHVSLLPIPCLSRCLQLASHCIEGRACVADSCETGWIRAVYAPLLSANHSPVGVSVLKHSIITTHKHPSLNGSQIPWMEAGGEDDGRLELAWKKSYSGSQRWAATSTHNVALHTD